MHATTGDFASTGSTGTALKPIHDWVSNYERMWSERFDALDAVLDELKESGNGD